MVEGIAAYGADTPIPLQIGPWHRGRAKLEVEGIDFDDGRSCYAVRVLGFSHPTGPDIHVDRTNPSLFDEPAPPDKRGKSWQTRQKAQPIDSKTPLTSEAEPAWDGSTLDVLRPVVKELGQSRTILPVHHKRAASSAGPKKPPSDDDKASTGERHGSGTGVAHASVRAARMPLPDGIVVVMWEAARSLPTRAPDVVGRVRAYTPAAGYSETLELVPVPMFSDAELALAVPSITASVREWCYVDIANEIPRGLLFVCLEAAGRTFCFAEIQRRSDATGGDGDKHAKEPYSGLLVEWTDETLLAEWILQFAAALRHAKGIVGSAIELAPPPGESRRYSHTRSASGQVPGQSALLTALGHFGVKTRRSSSSVA